MGKLIGAVLILSGAVGYGWYLAQQEKKHLEYLRDVKRALICMCTDLEYARFPMHELLKNAEECVGKAMAQCFYEMEKELEEQKRESVYMVWCQIWERHAKEFLFQDQELHIIQQAGQKLGGMEIRQQVELLRVAQEQLEDKIDILKGVEKENEKLYRNLSLLAGLFLVVMLL